MHDATGSMASPNFLVFLTDQQRADHLGCYGNTVLATPSIDGLARRGVVMDRFYVASPVCMPNRAALMTGRMSSAAGVRMNGVPLPRTARTCVDALREAGWRTALIGKCHLQNMTDAVPGWQRDPLQRALREATTELRVGPEYQQESLERWCDPEHRVRLPYYGFDHVELCLEHGDLVGGDYARWLAARGIDQRALTGPDRPGALDAMIAPQAWRTGLAEDDYPTAFVRDRTNAWLARYAAGARDRPFYLQCSFPDPHHPFTPPGRWFDAYRPEDVDLPTTCARPALDAAPLLRTLHEERAAGRRPAGSSRVMAVSVDEARQAIALNYGAIGMIDAAVGRVLAQLRDLGLEQSTVVLFLSDHGDFMGDHGLLLKGGLHYRSVVRMPFIWADSQGPAGVRRDQLASAIDVAPTILARAALPRWHGIHGLDLAPAFASAARLRDDVLIEEEGHRPLPGSDALPKLRTLVTRRHRLSLRASESWGELYDLDMDPSERRNLWSDPASTDVRAELTLRLAERMAQCADDCPRPARMA